jgi:CheY-like chemotaxis protein
MLLEDNADLALMMQQILSWRGHEVMYGRSGVEGIDLLKSAEGLPDVILCDLIMPDMDGTAFLQYLRSHETWSSIPFILMSANATDTDFASAIEIGANAFLPKPFGLSDLDSVLNQWDHSLSD